MMNLRIITGWIVLGLGLQVALPSVAVETPCNPLEKSCEEPLKESALADDEVADSNVEEKAPYVLKIIKRGEGKPRSENDTKEGKQDNRRVDVTLTRQVPVETLETRSVNLAQGGTVWVTKDPAALDRLLSVTSSESVSIEDNKLVSPVEFRIRSNYAAFLSRWELLIYKSGAGLQDKPLATVSGDDPGLLTIAQWGGSLRGKTRLEHGLELEYAVRVYDDQGRYDQTLNKKFSLVDADREKLRLEAPLLSLDEAVADLDAYESFAVEGIPVAGAKVRIHGLGIHDKDKLSINGEKVELSTDEAFVVEYLLPAGQHEFDIVANGEGDKKFEETLKVDLDTDYFFMVGLADVTVGENEVSGSIEPLAVDPHHYGGDIFVDGRLAFYLKGKIRGKYLLTAQMDTGTEDVSELFDDFHRKDPHSVFRRLDPDQYYLVYGDDSTLYDDTDSQGKIYLRMEWDKSSVLWGNFNTAFSGSDLAPFNRSLYGAQLLHQSLASTASGDSKTDVSAFVSEAQTAFRHNEFLGTGGSLYYLSDQDIVRGSEKVWVEVRRSGTERVVEKIPLVAGRDYDIDDFQGRLILTRPLLNISAQSGPSIIRDEPIDGDNTYLVVDYEYIPENFDAGKATTGVRAKQWLSDHVAIGGTWAHESRAVDDYDIKGVDLTLKKTDNTYLRAEVARSESNQTAGSFLSLDGGLNFTPYNSNSGASSGSATSIEARVSATDFSEDARDISVGAWIKNRDAGFSTASVDTGVATTDSGIEALAILSPTLSVSASATRLEKENVSRESALAVQLDAAVNDQTTVSAEARQVSEDDLAGQTDGAATIAAGKVSYDLNERVNLYGIAQATLARSGGYQKNNLLTAGAEIEANDQLRFNGELSTGSRGDGVLFGAEWLASESYSIYTNVSSENDRIGQQQHALTLGQRKSLSSKLKVYSEHQFTHEDQRNGVSHTLGLDHAFNNHTSGNLSLQMAAFEDQNGGTTDRDAISVGLDHNREKLQLGSRFEYRRDRGSAVDVRQWVVTNRFEYRKSPALRWQGKLNASLTNDMLANSDDAEFVEAGLGFALRPVTNDRLNLLGRVTWLYDLPTVTQSSSPDQRSLVGSMEGVYEFTRYLSFGAKIAYREGEIRLQRSTGSWIGNDATLAALRMNYRVPFGLDFLVSWHWLSSQASDSLKQGAMIAVGRSVSDHLKFSIGYNFTDFDDNLTNDSYDVKGWFFNLVGTY